MKFMRPLKLKQSAPARFRAIRPSVVYAPTREIWRRCLRIRWRLLALTLSCVFRNRCPIRLESISNSACNCSLNRIIICRAAPAHNASSTSPLMKKTCCVWSRAKTLGASRPAERGQTFRHLIKRPAIAKPSRVVI